MSEKSKADQMLELLWLVQRKRPSLEEARWSAPSEDLEMLFALEQHGFVELEHGQDNGVPVTYYVPTALGVAVMKVTL
jgi:hypothetical protein